METFILCLLVVLLAAAGTVVGEDIVNECGAVGGECGDADDCPSHALLPGCPRHQVCCLHNHSTNILEAGGRATCDRKKRKCRRIGGQCFDPSEDRTCDFIKINRCRADRSCCVNCTNQNIPGKCKRLYGGWCNASCGTDYLKVGNCKAGCKCCGCERLDECKTAGGLCVTEESQCEDRLESSWCSGEQCHCCIPDCTNSLRCKIIRGRCLGKCSPPDMSYPTLCRDPDCTCCSSKKPNSLITCLLMGGLCYNAGLAQCPGTTYGNCGFSRILCCLRD